MKKSKKLLISVVALMVTLGLATSATFAWFSMNQNVTVAGFDVNATTGSDGLFITYGVASESSQFSNTVDSATILADTAVWKKSGDKTLGYTAVTSTDGKSFKLENATEDIAANTIVTEGRDVSYISMKFTFRSTIPMDIYLDGNGAKIETAGTTWTSQQKAWTGYIASNYSDSTSEVAQAVGDPLNARAANAARISFVNNTVTRNESTTEVQPVSGNAPIWNPNADKGYKSTEHNMASDFNKFHYGTPDVTEVTPAASLVPYTDTSSLTTATKLGTTSENGSLNVAAAPYEAVITVNIWLEGTDGDCMRDLWNDMFKVSLAFYGKAVA